MKSQKNWNYNSPQFTYVQRKIEIFLDGTKQTGDGCIRHFAFATDHVDKIVERVRNAGYMKTNPVSPIRVSSS